jgi:2OG-Fe(II) oxygenase superfamily
MWRRWVRADTLAVAVVPFGCLGLLGEAYARTDLRDAEPASERACQPKQGSLPLPPSCSKLPDLLVVENAVPAFVIAQARAEVMRQSAAAEWSNTGNDADVRQDSVRWVRADDDSTSSALNECIRFLRSIPHWAYASRENDEIGLLVPQQCQLAVYRGDGRSSYQRHLDQCRGTVYELGLLEYWRLQDYRRRRLTAILYLNDSDRTAEEGGVLRCWVRHDKVDEGEGLFHLPVDIIPKGGTLVIFDSTRYVRSLR